MLKCKKIFILINYLSYFYNDQLISNILNNFYTPVFFEITYLKDIKQTNFYKLFVHNNNVRCPLALITPTIYFL